MAGNLRFEHLMKIDRGQIKSRYGVIHSEKIQVLTLNYSYITITWALEKGVPISSPICTSTIFPPSVHAHNLFSSLTSA